MLVSKFIDRVQARLQAEVEAIGVEAEAVDATAASTSLVLISIQ